MKRGRLCALLLALALTWGCSPGLQDGPGPEPGPGPGPDAHHLDPSRPEVQEAWAAFRRGEFAVARRGLSYDAELVRILNFFEHGSEDPEAMLELLERRLDRQTVAALAQRLTPETPGGEYVHTRHLLTSLHVEAHPEALVAQARQLSERVGSQHLKDALKRVMTQLGKRVAGERKRTVGVILPLSGPFSRLGEAALRSIQLAIGKHKVRLVIKDSRGDAKAAARLVDQLVYEHGVLAILGPIGAYESTSAARRATELNVPIVVLSAREAVPEEGRHVFRTRITASRQGIGLARYAVRDMSIKKFGLLISDTPYGWALAGAFWDEASKLGAEVTNVVTYARGTTEWRAITQRLVGGTKGKNAQPAFRGLLIADTHQAVRRLVPFFPYWGVRIKKRPGRGHGVQLFGGDAWNHPNVIDEAERQTDNAIFADSFYPDESNPRVERFVTRFYAKYREAPTPFEAEVYDAARLIERAVTKADTISRGAVLGALTRMKPFKGVTGVMRFDSHGEVNKDVVLLTVDGDTIRPRNSEAEERVLRRDRR